MNDKRVIVITGASRGLGKSIALRFGKAGCRILINYSEQREQALAAEAEIRESGGEAVAFRADVTVSADVEKMFCYVVETWGRLDVLINNAGISRDGLLLRMPEHDWDTVLSANMKGPFYCIRAAAEFMAGKREGAIINIASITGVKGREGQANYAASKAGLIGLTKAAAREFGSVNIRVNAVLPGYLMTRMGDTVSSTMQDRILQENVLGRGSDLEEAADFIHYLSGMKNVSGQVFNMDSRIL